MSDKVDFDAYTHDYNRLLNESTRFFSSSESYFAAYKVEEVRRALQTPVRRILEFGCGIGRNIAFLRKAFPEADIIGTDVSAASLEQAATENPAQAFHLEAPTLQLGRFDLIFVAGVYHHISPPERAAVSRLLRDRLATSGSLCVFEHNPYNPVTRRIVNNCPYDADAVLLKPSELEGLLQGAGLQVAARRYCLFVPPRLGALQSMERLLTWLPLGGQYWIHARPAA